MIVPHVARDLDATFVAQQLWIAIPLAMLGGFGLAGGWLADRLGHAALLRAGVALSAAGAVMAGLAWTAPVMVGARFVQGVGAALYVPAALAMLRDLEDSPGAVRLWTSATSLAALSAPFFASLVVVVASWRFVFAAEAVALLVVAVAGRGLARARRSVAAGRVGAHLVLGVGLAGLIATPAMGGAWARSVVMTLASVFVISGVALLWRSSPALFSSAQRELNLFTALAYGAVGLLPFVLSVFLQETVLLGTLAVGALLSADGAVLAVATGRLGKVRRDTRTSLAVGGAVAAAGALVLLGLPATGHAGFVVLGLGVVGLGMALFVAPLTTAVLAGAAPGHAGQAAALNLAVARTAAAVTIVAVAPLLTVAYANAPAADDLRPAARERLSVEHPLAASAAPAEQRGAARSAAEVAAAAAIVACSALLAAAGTSATRRRRRSVPVEQPPGQQDERGDEHR